MKKKIDKANIDFGINYVIDTIKEKQFTTLSTINSGMIELFWNVGSLLNNSLYKGDLSPTEDLIRGQISDVLVPVFGPYFSVENLLIMQVFASKCPPNELREVSFGICWDYIPVFNQIEQQTWKYYIHTIHEHGLTPEQLKQLIKSNILKPVHEIEDLLPYLITRYKEKSYKGVMGIDLFFRKNKAVDFRKLFEPKDEDFIEPNDIVYGDLLEIIYQKIVYFQFHFNKIAHAQVNCSFLSIGHQLISSVQALNPKVTLEEFVNRVIQQLNPNFLDEEWLLDCVKFAKSYQVGEPVDFAHTINFAHIKVLLEVASDKARVYYADIVFERNLTPNQLKDLINEDIKQERAFVSPKNTASTIKTIVSKQGGENIIVHIRSIEQKSASNTCMNSNIFTNQDVMSFLKDA